MTYRETLSFCCCKEMVGDDMHADEAGWSREEVRTSLNPDGLAFIVDMN